MTTDTIRITFPDGGAWSAKGLGYHISECDAASHRAGSAPHCALLDLIEPVLNSDPGDDPDTLGDGEFRLVGWDGEDLVYERAA
jgi:hypothetical protein